ncbi:response regulator [Streptomyces aureoversilis]|uniref:Response regulator n=1 Tax=Streptomyces aureoversilis TaxID=67277 RepID=A0ABV9ZW13_9ACTN
MAAHRYDAAVVDIRMPPTHTDEGIRAAIRLRRITHPPAVLILSAHTEQSFAIDVLAAGATGVGDLLKKQVGRVQQFLDVLHRLAASGTAIDPEVSTGCSHADGPWKPWPPDRTRTRDPALMAQVVDRPAAGPADAPPRCLPGPDQRSGRNRGDHQCLAAETTPRMEDVCREMSRAVMLLVPPRPEDHGQVRSPRTGPAGHPPAVVR